MRREHVRDLLRAGRGRVARRSTTRSTRSRSSPSSRSASRRSIITARCGRAFPKSSTARERRRSRSSTIAARIAARGDGVLVTRVEPTAVERAARSRSRRRAAMPSRAPRTSPASSHRRPAEGTVADRHRGNERPAGRRGGGGHTASALGDCVARVTDVGVAGIHRLLARATSSTRAAVVIVVAGMDGALPSVVGGLVRGPVIAVPTSVGYGASFQRHRRAADDAEQLRGGRHGRKHR